MDRGRKRNDSMQKNDDPPEEKRAASMRRPLIHRCERNAKNAHVAPSDIR